MLNPSTADGTVDDPTIRRCMGFATAWGYSRLVVRNLFPVRARDPKELLMLDRPTGGAAGTRSLAAATSADQIVVAWGAFVPFGRSRFANDLLSSQSLMCLGTTKSGMPRHPLYVKAGQTLERFSPDKAS